eukprot:gnl/TRDRNA2_/TRDRNA2_158470_c0_seq1.p1 gnl/TRDRNA2_/TRDRNA2_158470_c0~~gnl/TRDRNA2_/TRDRNA2_158470_c0_seq1.p1  ORF type:complete len:368 (-),score=64.69 gnl/TRDRNA2_/TRDRNA2_158470_c0_seq1:85-1188(-)
MKMATSQKQQKRAVGPALRKQSKQTAPSQAVVKSKIARAQSWLGSSAKVEAWLRLRRLELPRLLAEGKGLMKFRGLLPHHVAEGVRLALQALPESQWERAGEGERDDVRYADRVRHSFSITEVEAEATLLGASRLLAKLLPGTLPNFAAARYGRSDRISPHDDLVPERYSVQEVRRVESAYSNAGLASAVRMWRSGTKAGGSASATPSSTDLERAMRSGDIEAVRRAVAAQAAGGSVMTAAGSGKKLNYVRIVAAAYYLNPVWPQSFGGVLRDLETKKQHLPEFNTLIAFEVPRMHEVSAVCCPPAMARYSIFGWWLLEEKEARAAKAAGKAKAKPAQTAKQRKAAAALAPSVAGRRVLRKPAASKK